jgi:hypothetical protein
MFIKLLILIGLVLSVHTAGAVSSIPARYYAQGTFDAAMLTKISSAITTAIAANNFSTMASSISSELNTVYHISWNVIVTSPVSISTSGDTVVFGYAYKDHWLWIDNFGASNYSITIWKDYNCGVALDIAYTASNLNFVSSSGLYSLGFDSFTRFPYVRSKILAADINAWDNALFLSDALNSYYFGSYSVVVSTDINQMSGSICVYSDILNNASVPNYVVNTFMLGNLSYTILVIKTANTYNDLNSSAATKPTIANMSAIPCITGLGYQSISTPQCQGLPVHIYRAILAPGAANYVFSIYEVYSNWAYVGLADFKSAFGFEDLAGSLAVLGMYYVPTPGVNHTFPGLIS